MHSQVPAACQYGTRLCITEVWMADTAYTLTHSMSCTALQHASHNALLRLAPNNVYIRLVIKLLVCARDR